LKYASKDFCVGRQDLGKAREEVKNECDRRRHGLAAVKLPGGEDQKMKGGNLRSSRVTERGQGHGVFGELRQKKIERRHGFPNNQKSVKLDKLRNGRGDSGEKKKGIQSLDWPRGASDLKERIRVKGVRGAVGPNTRRNGQVVSLSKKEVRMKEWRRALVKK